MIAPYTLMQHIPNYLHFMMFNYITKYKTEDYEKEHE
jgi:hypothetical protein